MKSKRAKVTSIGDYSPAGFRWLRLKRLHYLDRKGNERTWESAERSTRPASGVDAVAVYARLVSETENTEKLVLVSQFRPPLDKYVLELPAGLVDSGETPSEAALRELREETGLVGRSAEESPLLFSDPGLSNASMKLVEVTVDMDDARNRFPKQALDEGEDIAVHYVSASGLRRELESLCEAEDLVVDARLWTIAFGKEVGEASGGKGAGSFSAFVSTIDPSTAFFAGAVFASTAVVAGLVKGLFFSK